MSRVTINGLKLSSERFHLADEMGLFGSFEQTVAHRYV